MINDQISAAQIVPRGTEDGSSGSAADSPQPTAKKINTERIIIMAREDTSGRLRVSLSEALNLHPQPKHLTTFHYTIPLTASCRLRNPYHHHLLVNLWGYPQSFPSISPVRFTSPRLSLLTQSRSLLHLIPKPITLPFHPLSYPHSTNLSSYRSLFIIESPDFV